jgi:hypothetical protein
MTLRHSITRIAAAIVGIAAIGASVWQLMRGVPVQGPHLPLHTDVLFAPIGLLVGSALVVIACAPRRWW